jgi:hypothetical protein
VAYSPTYPYGSDGGGWLLPHHGLDFGSAPSAPVIAVDDGVVAYAGDDTSQRFGPQNDFYGNLVVLRHRARLGGRNLFSLYGHLAEVRVERGDVVERGQEVGLVGGTGIALGPHLHLEFRMDERDYGTTLNPSLLMAPGPGQGALVGRMARKAGKSEPGVTVALFRRTAGGVEWVAQTTSYLEGSFNRGPDLEEDFTFPDLPSGEYIVERVDGGPAAKSELRIEAGELTLVTLRPSRSSNVAAEVTATPTAGKDSAAGDVAAATPTTSTLAPTGSTAPLPESRSESELPSPSDDP